MINYSLNAEALAHKNEIGNKAFNLAKVAEVIGEDIIANGFVITMESLQNCDVKKIANEIYIECLKKNIRFPIILRSSANVEDSMHSFAGIFESYICGNSNDIYKGLKKVLLAKESERLQIYCNRIHIDSSSVRLAVIVQTVVKADYSGVAFSKNPISNDDSVIYIEYLMNNTSGVEAGMQNPFNVSFSKIGDKLIVPESKMFESLRECILRLETLFEKAIDVEWAYSRGELKIFQVRPITT